MPSYGILCLWLAALNRKPQLLRTIVQHYRARATLVALSSSAVRRPIYGRGFSFFRFRRACIRLRPPLFGFVSATFCEAIELRRNVLAFAELDWLSAVVSDANQFAAQSLNRLNVLQ
jgi:hypothetical protein